MVDGEVGRGTKGGKDSLDIKNRLGNKDSENGREGGKESRDGGDSKDCKDSENTVETAKEIMKGEMVQTVKFKKEVENIVTLNS